MIDVRGGSSFVVGFTLVAALAFAGPRGADADGSAFKKVTGVPSANPREGVQPTLLGPGHALARIVSGTDPLENPSGVITHFGLLSNQTKTEPDENTYLVLNATPAARHPATTTARTFSSRAMRTAEVWRT